MSFSKPVSSTTKEAVWNFNCAFLLRMRYSWTNCTGNSAFCTINVYFLCNSTERTSATHTKTNSNDQEDVNKVVEFWPRDSIPVASSAAQTNWVKVARFMADTFVASCYLCDKNLYAKNSNRWYLKDKDKEKQNWDFILFLLLSVFCLL